MGLLDGKNLLVTGILTDKSIAFEVARLAQLEGANVVATAFGKAARLTAATVKRLPKPTPVEPLDVTDPEELASLADRCKAHVDTLEGVVHSIGFAPTRIMGGNFMTGQWPDVATAIETSAFSLKSLAEATLPLLQPGAGITGLTFDAAFAWPVYDWMGVAKAALESAARYLARDLGPSRIRVNLVAAGPIKTVAATAIPGFDQMEGTWSARAPLGWDSASPVAAAKAVIALTSDLFPATTGEIVHVDGGVHAMGQ
ncbi:MAG: enoyl-ACP reductase FabI [Bifidobacteriaceae bacterium]|jgi:enoyl-[acyl-carrier protein] reductase I|nr:enoyl-ACP reductase FabI [Bifidobacteriaceae bacterium]